MSHINTSVVSISCCGVIFSCQTTHLQRLTPHLCPVVCSISDYQHMEVTVFVLLNVTSSQPPAKRAQSRRNVTQARQNVRGLTPCFPSISVILTQRVIPLAYFFVSRFSSWCSVAVVWTNRDVTKMWISGAAGCLSAADVTTHLLSRSDRGASLLFWWGNANELNCSWGYLAGVE